MSNGVSMKDLKKARKEGKNLADLIRKNGQVPYEDRPDNEKNIKDVMSDAYMRKLSTRIKKNSHY